MNALPPQHEVGVAQTLRHHWFYLRPNERYWIPFSLVDSAHLEQAWTSAAGNPALQVSGGCGLVRVVNGCCRCWYPLTEVATTSTFTPGAAQPSTGVSHLPKFAAAPGFSKETVTGGTCRIVRMLPFVWRFVGVLSAPLSLPFPLLLCQKSEIDAPICLTLMM